MGKENIVVAFDEKGHKVVLLNTILFYGKKNLPWDKIEEYLKRYIGQIIKISETGEEVNIESDFPDEFAHSQDTVSVRGPNAKAKAKYGWNRYLTRFALPVLNEENVLLYYNVYLATLIVRKDSKKKLYLYDVVHVKKEGKSVFKL